MEFRALGPVGVTADGTEVVLGGSKQRLVLALLLIRANGTVSSGRLIDDVWGEAPPLSARNTLQTYVSQLRKAIGRDRIETSAAGYRLVIGHGDKFDALEFVQAVEVGHVERLDRILATWTEPPFADLAEEPALHGEIARLEELRGTANEILVDAALDAGRHNEVIGRLVSLTDRYPFRERLWAQLMIAQYRSARQTDALRTYERVRTTLVEQLGVDPGPELRDTYARILVHDASLDPDRDIQPDQAPDIDADARTATSADRSVVTRRRTGRRVVFATVLLSVAVGASILVATSARNPPSVTSDGRMITVPPDVSMVVVDAATGEPISAVDAAQVRAPVETIFDGTDFWVLNLEPLSFVQIDGGSGAVLRQIASPVDDVGFFAADGDSLWITHVTEPTVVRVDIARGIEAARSEALPGAGGSPGVVKAGGSLWVVRPDVGALVRLDPATLELRQEFRGQPSIHAVAAADGAIWTAGPRHVNRIDPVTDDVVTGRTDAESFYVAAGDGYGWTTDEFAGVAYQVDATGHVVATYPTGEGARSLSYDDSVVWVGNQDAGTVTGIAVTDGTRLSFAFDRPVQTVAAGNGRVLVLLAAPSPTALSGEMIKLFIPAYQLETLDPALPGTPTGRQVLSATCGGLLRLDTDGKVKHDLAIGLPQVSNDGRTYRFTLRPGVRFSPPSNELIDAQTFKITIQRALAQRLGEGAPGIRALPDLVGVDAYRSGVSNEVTGIEADGLDLTLTLTSPSDDLLERLTDPALCAVPASASTDTSVAVPLNGTGGEQALASAGPYYISQRLNGEYLVLLANPNYRGTRPPLLDGVALREGVSYDEATRSLDAGHGDGLTGLAIGETIQADRFGDRAACISSLPDRLGIEPPRVDLAALCRNDESTD